jgi:hypothetical protein
LDFDTIGSLAPNLRSLSLRSENISSKIIPSLPPSIISAKRAFAHLAFARFGDYARECLTLLQSSDACPDLRHLALDVACIYKAETVETLQKELTQVVSMAEHLNIHFRFEGYMRGPNGEGMRHWLVQTPDYNPDRVWTPFGYEGNTG